MTTAADHPGARLGRPARGPGSVATWGRRFAALAVDWVASSLVAAGLTGGASLSSTGGRGWETWLPLLVFLAEGSLLTPLVGGSFGQVVTRLAVVHLDGRPVSLLVALVRTTMICLVVPPLIFNKDRRGLHDLASSTVAVLRP